MANPTKTIGAEFQALPLDFLVSAPLIAAVKAQALAAAATKDFLLGMTEGDTHKPITLPFSIEQTLEGKKTNSLEINAPLLSLVPVPHLRIDSITTKFNFEISQTLTDQSESEKGVSLSVSGGSPWVKASLKGSASSKSSHESTTNRSGQLEVTVQASESPIPEGLARVLSLLASAIQPPESDKK